MGLGTAPPSVFFSLLGSTTPARSSQRAGCLALPFPGRASTLTAGGGWVGEDGRRGGWPQVWAPASALGAGHTLNLSTPSPTSVLASTLEPSNPPLHLGSHGCCFWNAHTADTVTSLCAYVHRPGMAGRLASKAVPSVCHFTFPQQKGPGDWRKCATGR